MSEELLESPKLQLNRPDVRVGLIWNDCKATATEVPRS